MIGKGYYLYHKKDAHPILPVTVTSLYESELFSLRTEHEYNWTHQRFSRHELSARLSLDRMSLELGIDHYDPLIARQNRLF